jgi:glutathione S-transferase
MKLYDSDRAPNPRRVRIFLAEKNISVPSVMIDLANMEHRGEAYSRLNPWQLIPSLVLDDGTVISETVAICRYFEGLQPDPPLFGVGALESATVEMWNRRIELNLYGAIAAAFRHSHPAMAEREKPQVQEWGEVNRARVPTELARIDAQLSRHRFVAGERFSIADITLLCSVDFMRIIKQQITDEMPHLARWKALVSARPSAAA